MTKNGYHTKRLSLGDSGPRKSPGASEIGAMLEDYAGEQRAAVRFGNVRVEAWGPIVGCASVRE